MWLVAALIAAGLSLVAATSCAEARLRCVYRTGCGAALNNYMYLCGDVLSGPPTTACPEQCQHALIALTSTEEGKALSTCRCEDEYCVDAKQRIEVCRPQVLQAANATASCRLSQLICLADAQCATALEYYHQLCRAMFKGRKCSNKCLNSIAILKKQEKAAALTVCQCDGYEDYDCPRMQNNLDRLCFHKIKKTHEHDDKQDVETTTMSNETKESSSCVVLFTKTLVVLTSLVCYLFYNNT